MDQNIVIRMVRHALQSEGTQPGIAVLNARVRARTHTQKGLRHRNSPTCTLSQNGYGELYVGTAMDPCLSYTIQPHQIVPSAQSMVFDLKL